MKKILSLFISLSLLLSAFCCIPAKANLYEGYPYLSLDFEDSDSVEKLQSAGVLGGNLGSTWKAGGAAGSKGCVTVTDKVHWGSENIYLPKPLTIGRTYRMSMWVRVNLDDFEGKTAAVNVILYTKSAVSGGSAYKSVSLTGTITPNTWSYVSGEFLWDGYAHDEKGGVTTSVDPDAPVRVCPRMDSTGSTLYMRLKNTDKYKNDTSFALSYDMDDIIIEPVPVEKEKCDDSFALAADFEGGKTHGLGGVNSVVEDAERGKVGYGKFNMGSFASITAYDAIKVNHMYKVSAWIKRIDDLCVYGGDTTQVFCFGNPEDRVDYTNIAPSIKWPASYAKNRITCQNQWTYFEWYIKYEARTFDAYHPSVGFRIGNLAASKDKTGRGEIGLEGVEVYIDDFMIQDLGLVTNGDFEQGETSVYRITETKQETKTDAVLGWATSDATTAASNDVRADAETESTKSMQVNITADGGKAYQGVFLENNKDYKISFWAKGEDLADGETKPMNLVLNRKVPTVHASDVYEVPDYEIISGDWLLTNEWRKYECTYEMAFTSSVTPTGNTVPRMPFLYLEVDGNKAGTKFLVDDFEIVDANYVAPDTRYPYPRVELVDLEAGAAFMDGAKVTFVYDFISEVDHMEGRSVIRILSSSDNENWSILDHIIADYGFAEYIIPKETIGRYLKAEILPVDENDGVYEVGDMLPVEMGLVRPSAIISATLGEFDTANGTITGTLLIENNKLDGDSIDVFLAIVLYDANGGIIRYDSKPISVGANSTDNISLSVATANVEGLAPVAYAKAFVWGGTSILDTDMTPYAEVLTPGTSGMFYPDLSETEKPTADVSMDISGSNIDVTASTESAAGAVTARITNEDNTSVYGIDQKTKNSDGTYSFRFTMPQDAPTGTYTLTLGGGIAPVVRDFSYTNPYDMMDFLNVLDDAPAYAIYDLLISDAHLLPYDFSAYFDLPDPIRLQVDNEIANWNLYTDLKTLSATIEFFQTAMDEVMTRAIVINENTDFDTWYNALNQIPGVDTKYFEDLEQEIRFYYHKSPYGNDIQADAIAIAIDEAQLLAVTDMYDYITVRDAYFYFEEKGIVRIDRLDSCTTTEINKLFKELKSQMDDICTIADYEALAYEILAEMEAENNTSSGGGGGSIGGGTGGSGGGGGTHSPSTESSKTVDWMIGYPTPVSGKAVLAIYSGGKLLSTKTYVLDGIYTLPLTVSYYPSWNATHAKFMVFDSFSTMCPIAALKTLTLE